MLPLLCAAAGGVLAGARSLIAIGEWIDDAPQSVLALFGFPADPLTGVRPTPHAATVRRLLQRLDADVLDAAIGAFLRARGPSPQPDEQPEPRAVAVDGKTVRGSRTATATAVQLPAAMDHHACQAVQIVRWRRELGTGKLTIERVYVITGLDVFGATPAELPPGSEVTGASRTSCTTSVTGPSARATPKSAPDTSPAPWPAHATSPSASSGRTATPTSPPPSATPAATTGGL